MEIKKILETLIEGLVIQGERFQYAEIRRKRGDKNPPWLDLVALQKVKPRERVLFAIEETTLGAGVLLDALVKNRIRLIR